MLKSKFLVMILIILSVFTLFITNVSAFSFTSGGITVNYDNFEESLKEYTFIFSKAFSNGDVRWHLISCEVEPYFNDGRIFFPNNKYLSSQYYNSSGSVSSLISCTGSSTSIDDGIIYSNFNIKDLDGNVFFRKTALTLGEVLEKNSPVKTFQTMMSGMIVSLMVLLVSLVGFWKAWSLLSNSLRKA